MASVRLIWLLACVPGTVRAVDSPSMTDRGYHDDDDDGGGGDGRGAVAGGSGAAALVADEVPCRARSPPTVTATTVTS